MRDGKECRLYGVIGYRAKAKAKVIGYRERRQGMPSLQAANFLITNYTNFSFSPLHRTLLR